MFHPILLQFLALLASAGIGSGPHAPSRAHPPSRFPEVRGSNLEGREFRLPADFEGERNIVVIAFERGQQSQVDTWLPLARRLEDEMPHVRAYELPTIRKLPGFVRGWIDGGMASGIPDPRARASTITLYLDKKPFRQSLGIETEETITVVVVDREGAVYWQTLGVWTPEKEAVLRTIVQP